MAEPLGQQLAYSLHYVRLGTPKGILLNLSGYGYPHPHLTFTLTPALTLTLAFTLTL